MKLDGKKIWIVPVVVVVFLMVLATAFYPAYNPEPKDIPVAVINEDTGSEMQGEEMNIGQTLSENLTSQENDAVKFYTFDSTEEFDEWVEDNESITALIFGENFSKNAMSQGQNILMNAKQQEIQEQIESGELSPKEINELQEGQGGMTPAELTEPDQANITIRVDQGANPMLSQAASQIVTTMANGINDQISSQNINLLSENDIDIPSSEVESLKNPVAIETITLNEIESNQANGNASMVMFMPVWLASMVTSVLLFFFIRSQKDTLDAKRRKNLAWLVPSIVTVTSFVGGFGYVYYMTWVMNFNIPDPSMTAFYISISILGFTSLILGLLVLIGIATIPIFLLFLFFTMQAIMLPKQMLPQFYQDYIIGWNPFGYYTSTLKELIYTGTNLTMNTTMWMFVGFIVFGILSFYSVLFFKNRKKTK